MSNQHRISDGSVSMPNSPPVAQQASKGLPPPNFNARATALLLARQYLMECVKPNNREMYDFLMNVNAVMTMRIVDFTFPERSYITQVADKNDFLTIWLAFGAIIYKQEKIQDNTGMREWRSYIVETDINMVHVLVETQ